MDRIKENSTENGLQQAAGETPWPDVACEAVEYLAPLATVIKFGLESARRQLGITIERTVFVNARSVYAILKAAFERDKDDKARTLLDAFCRDPGLYGRELIDLVAQRTAAAPDDLGRKLVAMAKRWGQQA